MSILVTGSTGHLGEALVRTLRDGGHDVIGMDLLESPFTDRIGSITDRNFVARGMEGVDAVLHAATLHKPHIATHSRQAFVDTNITGTLHLLEEAVGANVSRFVFTSTTSVFGRALRPPPGAPAVWVTEALTPVPRNIYGVTKAAAEDLCQLAHQHDGLACLILRTSRFFPEPDDDPSVRARFDDGNVKAVEFLYRRADIEDVVAGHLCALDGAAAIGFGKFIISATTPFMPDDVAALTTDAPRVVRNRAPAFEAEFARRGWRIFPRIDRVYDNGRARAQLGWSPRYAFAHQLSRLQADEDPRSPLARAIGSKGYHPHGLAGKPYAIGRDV